MLSLSVWLCPVGVLPVAASEGSFRPVSALDGGARPHGDGEAGRGGGGLRARRRLPAHAGEGQGPVVLRIQ